MGKLKNAMITACLSLVSMQGLSATVASVKGIGMGGACVSFPLDSGVMAYNPAGIANLCNRVDVGLYAIYNNGSTTTSGNLLPIVNRTDTNQSPWAFSPEVGFVYHVHPRIAFGFLIYNEKDLRVKYNRNFPLIGTTPVGFEYTLEILAPTIAVIPFENHSISLTLNYMVDRFKLKGAEVLANTFHPFSIAPQYVTNKGYNYSNGVGLTLGYQGIFFDGLFRVGFAWRPKTSMKKLSQYKGFIAQQGRFDIPEVFRVGISSTPINDWTVALDYQLIRYEKIPTLTNNFDIFTPDLLGSNDGSGFGWTDQHFIRFGINYDFSPCLSFRTGYRHANLSFKKENVAPNLLTLDTTVDFLTFGGTWVFLRDFELNALFAYGFNRKASGPLPVLFGGGTIEVQQETYVAALSLSWYY